MAALLSLTGMAAPLLFPLLHVTVDDGLDLLLFGCDVGLSHLFTEPQVVLDGFGGRRSSHYWQLLLVAPICEVQLPLLDCFDPAGDRRKGGRAYSGQKCMKK